MIAKSSKRKHTRALAAGLATAGLILAAGAAMATTLNETGSSLLYPLFNLWQPVYTKAHPDVKITTASTGSGTGQAQSMNGLVQIGASDAYLSDTQMRMHPGMLNIPTAISSQMVNYNVPRPEWQAHQAERPGARRYLCRQDHPLGRLADRKTQPRRSPTRSSRSLPSIAATAAATPSSSPST